MLIVYVFVALAGALASVEVLWPYGWLVALLCAPLGGSTLALVVATRVAWTEAVPSQARALA